MIDEAKKIILEQIASENGFTYELVATISLNESGCDENVKPYFEKTWRYFTTIGGFPLKIDKPTTVEIQAEALRILGEDEFNFQVNAHGAWQCVGSVLREMGYKAKTPPVGFYEQGKWSMLHLKNLRKQFVKKYQKEPSFEQLCGMYNGGFGAVTADDTKDYVAGYIKNSELHRKIV